MIGRESAFALSILGNLSHLNPSTELKPVPTRGIDLVFFRRYVRSSEAGGFDHTLVPYGSTSADSFVVASAVTQLTERIKPIVALRPNTTFPTVGAQQLATPPADPGAVALADRVVLLDAGRIAATGTHAGLLAVEEYRRIVTAYERVGKVPDGAR